MRRFLVVTLLVGALLLAWAGPFSGSGSDSESGAVGRGLGLGPDSANALDLFGSGDDESKAADAKPFWRSESKIPTAQPVGIPTSFADLAERVAPAVVSIQTSGTVQIGNQPGLPPGLQEFFGGSPFPNRGEMPERKSSGEGSGFVVSADGFIVTNNHVVEDMDEITVHFLDGTELEARVVGLDPKTDIALLKVDAAGKQLETIALGDSDRVRPGDWVVAIGNPFGLEHTVTAGIISAKHRREITNQARRQSYDDFLQTDAAINPGNSGGPLIDLQGRVIGINTAIRSNANTIGFSVPINQAKQILPQLRADGRVTRGWLGVQIQAITPDLVESFELDDDKGALVSQVMPDTPAANGGIERGDVILKFNGESIAEWRDLPIVVANAPVNEKAEVILLREGKLKTLKVKIGELKDPTQVARGEMTSSGADAFGLKAQDLTPALAEQLGVSTESGVLVTDVEPNGPADEAGIRRGDVIIELDQKSVESARDLAQKLEASDESVLVLVRRGDNTLYVPLKRAG